MINLATDTNWKVNEDRRLIILPLFFGYLLGSFASLRLWLATQKIPVAAKTATREAKPTDKLGNIKFWFICFITYSMLAVLAYLEIVFAVPLFSWIFGCFTGGILAVLVTMGFFDLIGLQKSVHRSPDETLLTYPRFDLRKGARTPWRKAQVWISSLLGFGITVVTLWSHSHVGASIIVFTIIYIIQGFPNGHTSSMRATIMGTIIFEVILLIYLTYVFALIHSTAKADEQERLDPTFSANSEEFYNWIYVPLVAFPLSYIIPISLRLDFANHYASAEARQYVHLITLEVVPAPKDKRQLSAGIVIPSIMPFAFKCPYFILTLLAWLLANAAVMKLLAHGWLPDFGRFMYMIYVLVCALPMVVMSVFAVALMRGEVERMWRYEERWELIPGAEKGTWVGEAIPGVVNMQE